MSRSLSLLLAGLAQFADVGDWGFRRGPKSYNGARNRHARHGSAKHTSRSKSAKRARSKQRMRSGGRS